MAELERIHSHMLWLGVAAHEGGFDTLFMYSWRDRETVMDLLETLSGNRVHYSANVIGGVKFDISQAQADATRKAIDFLEERLQFYLRVVTTDETFLARTRDVGTMTKEQATRFGTVGPTARASGVEMDIRIAAPYAAYADFPVKVVTNDRGDLEARFVVRIQELFETCRLIRDILDKMPPGELTTKVPRRLPAGETISRVEAPRGELLYFLKSNGTDKPDRLKIRTPSLCNWASVMQLAVGHKLADMPMMLAGIDPCFSCNDRLFSIKPAGGKGETQVWTWENLRRYGIEYYQR
jgi:NADH-quinone oxidoreductase subunit D